MARGWPGDGQGMARGSSSKSERLHHRFQRAVELQGLADRDSAGVADVVVADIKLGQRAVDLQGLADRGRAL
eukprot:6379374-Prymnesium_polylepis.1